MIVLGWSGEMCLYLFPVLRLHPSCLLRRFAWKTLCGRWIFTHCDMISLLLQGLKLLPPVLLQHLVFLPELPLVEGIYSFCCLSWRGGQVTGAPTFKTVVTAEEGALNCWAFTLGPTLWLCTYRFHASDCWTQASVWKVPNLQCSFLFFVRLKVPQKHTNLLFTDHRYCSFFLFLLFYCFCLFFFCYADEKNKKKMYPDQFEVTPFQ